jgi:hypothetical protein
LFRIDLRPQVIAQLRARDVRNDPTLITAFVKVTFICDKENIFGLLRDSLTELVINADAS